MKIVVLVIAALAGLFWGPQLLEGVPELMLGLGASRGVDRKPKKRGRQCVWPSPCRRLGAGLWGRRCRKCRGQKIPGRPARHELRSFVLANGRRSGVGESNGGRRAHRLSGRQLLLFARPRRPEAGQNGRGWVVPVGRALHLEEVLMKRELALLFWVLLLSGCACAGASPPKSSHALIGRATRNVP